ncbi:MAG: succinate dehydrogenase [Zetaproteobacteria bacterium CG06_land_8_20_14_3_00_59_53]|nr:MAG: hypothetical protein AUK36_08755 [Zetaproteobacteria bacterium CG2_30_59_37]PIO90817.1 MAG: succinate dehydrogenase [Zetaproteobacteria bacterium CG23_combo_of_CG06-09_8_20_14_all_59_86]PIQ64708.1 MAG: succinate dehydrogenase [Zetaproteobacteria bacterium CG11_big_fil_rev_8_21_14_0_20_59_439]PIU71126.1 MAG: succinate dehydrogenase [Zetaproteobacteria bacterium CG06_land_8_20_14_3_00_59_53]PIU96620.1 MAG: succinate dehydrogenase [Zetaproteobacteria bacterium CG03_land_8_20_14_0_80_59_51]
MMRALRRLSFGLVACAGMFACTVPPSHQHVQPVAKEQSQQQEQGIAGNPDFQIQPQHFDVGEVPEGEEAKARLFVRNTGLLPLHIVDVQSACGCTVSSLGNRDIAPGGFTTLDVTIDTTAKGDSIEKKVTVIDALGRKAQATLSLRVRENPHGSGMQGRGIFDGKCAACHVAPAKGKLKGAEIYAAVCAMCHGDEAKGAYAPALRGMDADGLSAVLQHGIDRRMPSFSAANGGPLSPLQISELSKWLSGLDE